MGLLTEPEWFPKALIPIVVLRQTAPNASFLHQTITADPLEPMGEFLPYHLKNGGVGPDMLQKVYTCMAENKIRYCLPDAAQRIRTIGENAKNGENSADAASIPIRAEHFSEGAESYWMTKVKRQRT